MTHAPTIQFRRERYGSLSHRRLGQSRAVDDVGTVRSTNDKVDPRRAGYPLKTLIEKAELRAMSAFGT